ncbi:hypothetical protein JHK87_018956 [Glycine soja]|nr:hypothetical protein JHK87_018956 [Glycine soja]
MFPFEWSKKGPLSLLDCDPYTATESEKNLTFGTLKSCLGLRVVSLVPVLRVFLRPSGPVFESTVNNNYSSFGVLSNPNSATEPSLNPQTFDSGSNLEEDNIFSFIHRIEQLEISPRKQEKGWEKRAASASKLTLLAKKLHPDRNKDDLEAEKKFQ